MASFAGITFLERGAANGALIPIHGFKQNVAILHVPNSDVNIIQVLGYGTQELSIPARVTAAQLVSMKAKVGTTGSLIYTGGTITTQLVEITEPQKVKPSTDLIMITLKFLTMWYQ